MATGYGNIDKIERERHAFELSASDRNGARVKLYVDQQTGDIVKTNRKERSRIVAPTTLLDKVNSACRATAPAGRSGF